MPRARTLAAPAVLLALAVALALVLHLRQQVRRALERASDARPLQLVPLPPPERPLRTWAGPEIEAVAFPGGELMTAGASGVWHAGRDVTDGLPSLRVSALALWAGEPVVALESGELALRRGGAWLELRSGWGRLHTRALVEAAGGELLIAAREGLFRARTGTSSVERLGSRAARTVAAGPGWLLVGGEQGLVRIESGRATPVAAPDPWVESVALADGGVYAVTAAGLARGPSAGPLQTVRGGESVVQAVGHEGRLWAVTDPPTNALLVWAKDGSPREEYVPSPARRVMSASGLLFADTEAGLERRDRDGWHLVRPRTGTLPAGSAHVTALARLRDRLFVGRFDGGLAVAAAAGEDLEWNAVPDASTWGTNALLASGGELWIAGLRGAARFDGTRVRPIDGPGAAFSLCATRDGVAVGYGQGVLLPGATLLSAFHGLPGNQALALAEQDALYVGTASGLGAISGRRVLWRVTGGEGKLPHPWVTALLAEQGSLLVGTWGGGLVRRLPDRTEGDARADAAGRFQPFPETAGLKVSPGALIAFAGLAWAGTDTDGLWRQTRDGARFERVRAALPSSRVTALFAEDDVLWVGTDQGLARLPPPSGE